MVQSTAWCQVVCSCDGGISVRTARMTVVQELELSLKSLREVRRFFLDNDYRTEIDRLKEFAALCERLKALKESGFFDAMCDSAIRLALKETE